MRIVEFADRMGKRLNHLKRWQANTVMCVSVPIAMALVLAMDHLIGLQSTNEIGSVIKQIVGFVVGLWLWFVISGLLASLIRREPDSD